MGQYLQLAVARLLNISHDSPELPPLKGSSDNILLASRNEGSKEESEIPRTRLKDISIASKVFPQEDLALGQAQE